MTKLLSCFAILFITQDQSWCQNLQNMDLPPEGLMHIHKEIETTAIYGANILSTASTLFCLITQPPFRHILKDSQRI